MSKRNAPAGIQKIVFVYVPPPAIVKQSVSKPYTGCTSSQSRHYKLKESSSHKLLCDVACVCLLIDGKTNKSRKVNCLISIGKLLR